MDHKGHGNQENARPMTAIASRQEIVLAALATEPGARFAPVHGLPEPRYAGLGGAARMRLVWVDHGGD
jgi:hypothetical protein